MHDRDRCRIQRLLMNEGTVWLNSSCRAPHEGESLLFSEPLETLVLYSTGGIREFFTRLEHKLDQGHYLAGWMSYEAGYGFEPDRFAEHGVGDSPVPLAWFGVYRSPERFSCAGSEWMFSGISGDEPFMISDFRFTLTPDEYFRAVGRVKEEIAGGNVYQVNFTLRYRFSFSGSPSLLFSALRLAQPGPYSALLNTGGRNILSFSPELFFTRSGSVIETMPMKGTAPRGINSEEDSRLKDGLGRCEKNLAENLMIVDLLRNDLGRICRPGSVHAAELFATQTYPTLHQMVSTIRGEERDDVGFYELFRALYPSGSITGAPKITAMKLIESLEPEPRGIYTGTVGFITPERDMVFNVAIRTLELSGQEGIYGTGSG
ncbi:MAG: aminodeoxychorismate synthase component I, partial [Chlorobiaceae bacterium]|nr:aminodeoxychorismate synthase component I [Chlorobiaceae bacterium]